MAIETTRPFVQLFVSVSSLVWLIPGQLFLVAWNGVSQEPHTGPTRSQLDAVQADLDILAEALYNELEV